MEMRTPKESVEHFLMSTEDGRELSQKCRDYYDHKQWTAQEEAILKERKQAAIVVNRIRPKVEGLCGLYEMRNSDPKAFPRTMKHEKASHAITDALRYVNDKNNFTEKRLDIAEDFFVEGYGGAIVEVKKSKNGPEIQINQIPWDRIYFDPASRKKDFKDARFMGMIVWMDLDDVPTFLPNKKIKLDELEDELFSADALQTTEDRPRWTSVEGKVKRVRICMHFEMVKGEWKMCIFSGDYKIISLQPSPYLDEDGLPTNPIELVSANVDRNNQRYGEVAGFLSQQDEINHRRSKFLHLSSVRQTFGNDNAIQDVEQAKKALRNPEGHLKINGDAKFGDDFGIIPTGDMSNAQVSLYQDAKNEMDRNSFSAPLAGNNNDNRLSGVALDKLQSGSSLELNRQFALLRGWELRIYKQVWWRVKQFWNEEKWIRVTDDQDNLRWVGLNSQVTAQQLLEEAINDESSTLESRQQSQQILQFLIQTQNPNLQQIVDVRNDTAALDVDIILDQSFDTVNIQQEQFELLAQFAQGADIDIVELIELSQLRGKDELVAKIEKRRASAAQAREQSMDTKLDRGMQAAKIQEVAARTGKTVAETEKTDIESVTKQIENVTLANAPLDKEPQVSV